jgi:hypothetical protein
MADGHLGKCKECARADVSQNYRANLEHYTAYERERFAKPERKAMVRKYANGRPEEKRRAAYLTSNAIREAALPLIFLSISTILAGCSAEAGDASRPEYVGKVIPVDQFVYAYEFRLSDGTLCVTRGGSDSGISCGWRAVTSVEDARP